MAERARIPETLGDVDESSEDGPNAANLCQRAHAALEQAEKLRFSRLENRECVESFVLASKYFLAASELVSSSSVSLVFDNIICARYRFHLKLLT